MNKRDSADFLFGCKNLYVLSIHPFDSTKTESKEYKELIKVGKEIMSQIGVQRFAGFMRDYQYRVDKWAAKIILEFGKLTFKSALVDSCLEQILRDEIESLPPKILNYRNKWIKSIKNELQQ